MRCGRQWRQNMPALCVPVARDEFALLTANDSWRLPVPPQQRNHGNFIVSLGQLLPLLAQQAEGLGVDVLPGFAASAPLFDAAGAVAGVRVGDMGLDADGNPGAGLCGRPGDPRALTTLMAEGCRGSLAKQLIDAVRAGCGALAADLRAGLQGTVATAGRPRHGSAWCSTRWAGRWTTPPMAAASCTTCRTIRFTWAMWSGSDYLDPRFSPFEAFQQFKHHPSIRKHCSMAARSSRPARAASPQVAGSRCRSSTCRAPCCWAMRRAR